MYPEVKRMCCMAMAAISLAATAADVDTLHVVGPFTMPQAILTDTADVNGKPFDADHVLMDKCVSPAQWTQAKPLEGGILPATEVNSVSLVGFEVENTLFAKCEVKLQGAAEHKVFIDGKEGASQNLTPGRHKVVMKVLQKAGKADTLKAQLVSEQEKYITLNPKGKRLYMLEDYLYGQRPRSASLSSTGRYMLLRDYTMRRNNQQEDRQLIIDLKNGTQLPALNFKQWASKGDRYISERKGTDLGTIYEYVDPATGETTPLLTDYSGKSGEFVADEHLMVIYDLNEGPKEDKQVFQVLEPDDRMAGWRNRYNVMLMDVESGRLTQLTQGQHNASADVSRDGKRMLLTVSENCSTERPFSFNTLLMVNLEDMQVDTLVRRDGFIGQAQFAPNGRDILVSGSPEAFGGIGINDPTGKIPSMIQTELFLMDGQTHEVRSLTRDFNPNIARWECSQCENKVYALCENRDHKNIFCLDLESGRWTELKLSESVVFNFALAAEKPMLCYTGQSESNSSRVYNVQLKGTKEQLVRDYDKAIMGDVALGTCETWNFKSSRGDSITGRYYLPPYFDETKKYPMLVYYYGGCSPVTTNLDSYYNFHGWAAMGYVVYVIQPSGCTGFGQEFAARHVNAYGDYTASDIIEGTKQFCREHTWVNDKKIGCLGASYGGFMTMYLQTQTDIFAAAMSHAGISNPASYWGFGYWGYSYSAISAANSYPWNNPELLTGHAPLFNADKIHTPILFLHGNADTNVPINESIQLFNALKILGRECAFVTVDGQNHHILDYEKRIKWVHTYYAWFAKWLQDDATWWDTMYPPKNLK